MMATIERINQADRTALLSDGRTVPIPKQIQNELFETPVEAESKQNAQQRLLDLQEMASNVTGGKEVGAAYAGLNQTSGLAGWASTIMDIGNAAADMWKAKERPYGGSLFEMAQEAAERYRGARRGKQEAFKGIAEQSPNASLVGKGLGIATDVFAPMGKMRAGAQAAILGTGLSENSLLDNPVGLAKEAAVDFALGEGIGKLASIPSKIRQGRVGVQEAARQAAAFESKEAQLASQYAKDRAAYDATIAGLPARQAQAQSQFSQDVLSQAAKLGTDISSSRLAKEAIELDKFINSTIHASALAGTREGNQLTNFFKKVIGSRPTEMSAQDIEHIYQAIESRMAKGASHEIPILNQFKEHLSKTLPTAAAEAKAFRTYGNRIASAIDKGISQAFQDVKSARGAVRLVEKQLGDIGFLGRLQQSVSQDVQQALKSGAIKDFGSKVKSGKIIDEIMPIIQNNPDMIALNSRLDQLISTIGTNQSTLTPLSQQAVQQFKSILNHLEKDIASKALQQMSSHQTPVSIVMKETADKVSKRLSKTLGSAPTLAAPPPPVAPSAGSPPAPFQSTNLYERLAESFESPNFYQSIKDQASSAGTRGSLAYGLMHLIPGVLPKAYAAKKGIDLARLGVKAGLRALSGTGKIAGAMQSTIEGAGRHLSAHQLPDLVKEIASKYPSYHDGILETPEDRRAAVYEIESNPYIKLEDKAVLQTKINRGKPIE